MSRKPVYFYDQDIGNYYYGRGHPMKPHRIRMTHDLILNTGLDEDLTILSPPPITPKDLTQFHSEDYVNFLQLIMPDNKDKFIPQMTRYNVGEDCPIFDGLFEFSSSCASSSISSAIAINKGETNVAINWSGGLHHAKRSEASGFCYINDIVLGILELLKRHQRVLYIDIDIHHGDGVEEAFYTTDRVMTCSFHKYGDYFPGTGHIDDIGIDAGKYFAVNVPLQDGIDDDMFVFLFKKVVDAINTFYKPDAIVLQCGADSVSGDKLGCFNLSSYAHGECVRHVFTLNKPTILLGGGGYTVKNVARVWTYETSIAIGAAKGTEVELDLEIPSCDYSSYYGPDYLMHIYPSFMINYNSWKDIEEIYEKIYENLKSIDRIPTSNSRTLLRDFWEMDKKMEVSERLGSKKMRLWDVQQSGTKLDKSSGFIVDNQEEEEEQESPVFGFANQKGEEK